jgi:hypothetical protein
MVCCDWVTSKEVPTSSVASHWSTGFSEGRCMYEQTTVMILELSQKVLKYARKEKEEENLITLRPVKMRVICKSC